MLGRKKISVKKNSTKKLWAEKNLDQTFFGPQKIGSKKILVEKYLCLKFFGLGKKLDRNFVWPKFFLGRNFVGQNKFGSK